MTDDLRELVRDLHAHLEATAELEITPRANQWLGEAHAAAADIVGEDAPESAIEKRARQVRSLLERIEETDNRTADEHIEAADEIAARIEERVARER